MKAVINKYTKEIEFLSYHAEFAESNVNVAGTFIAGADRYEIFDVSENLVPIDFKPSKYRYINGVFKKSTSYTGDSIETDVSSLQETITSQQQTIDDQAKQLATQDQLINDILVSMLMY